MEIQNNQEVLYKAALHINNYPKRVCAKFTNQKAWFG